MNHSFIAAIVLFVIAAPGTANADEAGIKANSLAVSDSGTNPSRIVNAQPTSKGIDGNQVADKKHVPEWVANAIAFLNVAVVFYIFWRSESSHRKERAYEHRRSISLFWVQDLILSPNLETIHEFFNKYELEMERLANPPTLPCSEQTRQNAQNQILDFKKDFHKIRRRVLDPLTTVSDNFQELGNIFSAIEDVVTNEYARIPGMAQTMNHSATTAIDNFRDLRRRFLTELHHSQMSLAC